MHKLILFSLFLSCCIDLSNVFCSDTTPPTRASSLRFNIPSNDQEYEDLIQEYEETKERLAIFLVNNPSILRELTQSQHGVRLLSILNLNPQKPPFSH